MKPTVVIIGAGSVEFTRELLGDILSFPELGSTGWCCTTSTPSGCRIGDVAEIHRHRTSTNWSLTIFTGALPVMTTSISAYCQYG